MPLSKLVVIKKMILLAKLFKLSFKTLFKFITNSLCNLDLVKLKFSKRDSIVFVNKL